MGIGSEQGMREQRRPTRWWRDRIANTLAGAICSDLCAHSAPAALHHRWYFWCDRQPLPTTLRFPVHHNLVRRRSNGSPHRQSLQQTRLRCRSSCLRVLFAASVQIDSSLLTTTKRLFFAKKTGRHTTFRSNRLQKKTGSKKT